MKLVIMRQKLKSEKLEERYSRRFENQSYVTSSKLPKTNNWIIEDGQTLSKSQVLNIIINAK